MCVYLNELPKDLMYSILDHVEDPLRLALVCKRFNEWKIDLIKDLFNKLNLFQDRKQKRSWQFLMKKVFKYPEAEFFIQDISEKYNNMKISFADSIITVRNWTTLRDNFDGKKIIIERLKSNNDALSDAIYVNSSSFINEQTCGHLKIDDSHHMTFPIKTSALIEEGKVGLNNLQRTSLYASIGDSVTIQLLSSTSIPQATKIVLEVLQKNSATDIQILSIFKKKFKSHPLNQFHTVCFYINKEFIKVKIMNLEVEQPVCCARLGPKSDIKIIHSKKRIYKS